MIPIPKPKFFERKIPAGQSEDDYFDEITARQTHILRDAVDRVSLVRLMLVTKYIGDRFKDTLFIPKFQSKSLKLHSNTKSRSFNAI